MASLFVCVHPRGADSLAATHLDKALRLYLVREMKMQLVGYYVENILSQLLVRRLLIAVQTRWITSRP
ncbi:MAG: hypothetical protein LC652_04380 [Halomonas sp.]|nr:hypothetical protein [Halomonas sp.]